MFFKYGNRELKVYFKDNDYFFKMKNEIFEIGKNKAKIVIAGEWEDKGGFIETTVNKRRQIANVTSIINA
ncbi:hypothetical protein AABD34_11465 [Staphylococcus saprophyticus]|uniref:hypothetical protein n=1 Tax=Staphylococcus saprophyticus TaxID=29385 RepID=UPI00398B63A5